MQIQPTPPRKQVMSKGTYYFLSVIFGVLSAQGYVLVAMGVLGIPYLFARWHRTLASHPMYTASMLLACTLAIAAGSIIARRTNKAVQDISVISLANADTANIPASDSLVRASEQPMQQQQTVLLRPATQNAETGQEQLLRASAGSGDSEP